MELTDDIAYGVHDLEDALELELVSIKEWDEEVVPLLEEIANCPLLQDREQHGRDFYREKLFSPVERKRKRAISVLVGYFIQKVSFEELNDFESPLLRFNAVLDKDAERCLNILKDFIFNNVIKRPQVEIFEFKARKMITELFDAYIEYPKLLSGLYSKSDKKKSTELHRAVCDYIAGMTDAYASKQYQRLFMPDIGSIYDR